MEISPGRESRDRKLFRDDFPDVFKQRFCLREFIRKSPSARASGGVRFHRCPLFSSPETSVPGLRPPGDLLFFMAVFTVCRKRPWPGAEKPVQNTFGMKPEEVNWILVLKYG